MENQIRRQREIVAEHIRRENAHDWPGVYDTFVQDDRAHYDVVPLQTRFKGIDGVRQFYEVISNAVPDLQIRVIAQYDTPGFTICETEIVGSHLGPYLGMEPSGNLIKIQLAAFYEFDDDCTKLTAERIYYDQASVLAQMAKR